MQHLVLSVGVLTDFVFGRREKAGSGGAGSVGSRETRFSFVVTS